MSSRRTTLGTISASQANVRMSMGASRTQKREKGRHSLAPPSSSRRSVSGSQRMSLGRPSLTGRKSVGGDMGFSSHTGPSSGRPSLGRPSLSGRQSMGGRLSVGGRSRRSSIHASATATSDPRPLSDKSYRSTCIKNLIKFLTENGYNAPISPKILTAPSNKDFIRIFQFLYSHIDPNYRWGQVKPEDEIPSLLRMLHYPFTVSKSAIFSCGSPHNWPKLLGALTWMVELVTYLQEVDISQFIFRAGSGEDDFDQEDEGDENEMFFEFLEKSYGAFLAYDTEQQNDYEKELAMSFEARNEAILEEQKMLEKEKADLQAELEQLKGQASPLEELEKKKHDMGSDIQKFKSLIDSLQGHLHKIKAKHEQAEQEHTQKRAELQQLEAKKAHLEDVYSKQEMSQADVERLKSARKTIDDQLRAVETRMQEIDEDMWRMQMSVSKRTEEVEHEATKFNTLATSLELVPASAARACGKDLSIKVLGGDGDQILSLRVDNVVQGVIEQAVEATRQERSRFAGEVLTLQESLNSLTDAMSTKQDEMSVMQHNLKAIEHQYQETKEAMSAEFKKSAETVQHLMDEVSKMRLSTESTRVEREQQLEALECRLATQRGEQQRDKGQMNQAMLEALRIVTAHKARVQSQLQELQTFAQSTFSSA